MGMFDMFRRPKPGGSDAMRARLEGAMAKRRLRGWNPPLETSMRWSLLADPDCWPARVNWW